ncbi:carbon-nitrogen hydrolase family protein [Chloroflexota bacterium]
MFEYPAPIFKAAAVQSGAVYRDDPVWLDVNATLDKAISFVNEAGRNGARLIVFPECFLPGFPFWSIDFTDDRFASIYYAYLSNSIEVPGPETEALCRAAKKADSYVVTGINERDKKYQGRMYNSILYISPRGEIIGTHRKICNTVFERLFHTQGDGGDNLKTVFHTEIGNLGGLICGEHMQHTLLHYYIMQGMQISCSMWPGMYFENNPPICCGLKTEIDIMTRSVCLSARVFAVLASTYIPEKDCPKNFYKNSVFNDPSQFFGGSAIIESHGEYVAGPVYDEETIVYGDIDLSLIPKTKLETNLAGTYSRWDLMSLNVRQQPYEPIVSMEVTEARMPAVAELERVRLLEEKVEDLERITRSVERETEATKGKTC